MKQPPIALLLAALALTVTGCQAGMPTAYEDGPNTERLALNEGSHDELREAILSRVPEGTTYEDAKSALEAEGFHCSYLRQQDSVFLYARPTEETAAATSEPVALLFPLIHHRTCDVQVLDRPLDRTAPIDSIKPPKNAVSIGN
jgi:hypothetical protein